MRDLADEDVPLPRPRGIGHDQRACHRVDAGRADRFDALRRLEADVRPWSPAGGPCGTIETPCPEGTDARLDVRLEHGQQSSRSIRRPTSSRSEVIVAAMSAGKSSRPSRH